MNLMTKAEVGGLLEYVTTAVRSRPCCVNLARRRRPTWIWSPSTGNVDMRLRTIILSVILSSAFPLFAQSTPAQQADPPTVSLPPELARVLSDYEDAWSRRDAAGLAQLFAEDGYVLAGGRPPQKGRTAIEQHYTGQGGPLALRAIAYAADGQVGYIIGGYASRRGEPDIGKFTLTLRKTADGRWLIVSDMDNPNARPQPQ